MTTDHILAEARSLRENPIFGQLLTELSEEARSRLVTTPAEETDRIRDHQAMAKTVEAIRERLDLMIQRHSPKPPSGLP